MESTSKDNKTIVYLTPQESRRFVMFHKYYFLIEALESFNYPTLKNGTITIFFNSNGEAVKIEKNEQFRI